MKSYISVLLGIALHSHSLSLKADGILPRDSLLPVQTNGPLAEVTEDDKKRLERIKIMAESGLATAQFALGYILECGKLSQSDNVQAFKWYRAGAIGGDAAAQYAVGRAYFDGIGVAQDRVEGIRWIKIAAERNVAVAQYALGLALDSGMGITRDESAAVGWYRKSSEQGIADAQMALAKALFVSKSTVIEELEACKWALIAAQGDEESWKRISPLLGSGLTTIQRLEVKRAAREFTPKPIRWDLPTP